MLPFPMLKNEYCKMQSLRLSLLQPKEMNSCSVFPKNPCVFFLYKVWNMFKDHVLWWYDICQFMTAPIHCKYLQNLIQQYHITPTILLDKIMHTKTIVSSRPPPWQINEQQSPHKVNCKSKPCTAFFGMGRRMCLSFSQPYDSDLSFFLFYSITK